MQSLTMQDWDIASHLDDVMEAREPSGHCLAEPPKQDIAPRHMAEALAAARKRTAGAIGAPKVCLLEVVAFVLGAVEQDRQQPSP